MSPALPCGMVKNTRKDCCDHDASNLRSAQHNGMPPASRFPEVRTQQRLVPPLIQRWIPHERQHYKHSFSPPPRTEPRRVPRTQPPRTETGRSAGGGDVAVLTVNGGGPAGGGGALLVEQGCSLAGGGAGMVPAVPHAGSRGDGESLRTFCVHASHPYLSSAVMTGFCFFHEAGVHIFLGSHSPQFGQYILLRVLQTCCGDCSAHS